MRLKLSSDDDGNQHILVVIRMSTKPRAGFIKSTCMFPRLNLLSGQEDIPIGLAEALQGLGEDAKKRAITNAVRRIYESINPEYFHTNGISAR